MALTTGKGLDCLWNANKVLQRSGAPAPNLDPMLPRWIEFLKRSTTTFDTQGLYKSRIIVTNQPGAVKRRVLRPRKIKQNIAGGDVSFAQVQNFLYF